MNWERLALGATGVALVVSLLSRPPSVGRGGSPATAAAPAASPRRVEGASNADSDEAACRRELDVCRDQAWTATAEAIKSDVRARRDGAGEKDAGAAARGSSVEAQQRELDDIAREHLRKGWKDKQAEILSSVRDVGTEPWIRKEMDKTLADFDRFGVDAAAKAQLRDGYASIWAHAGPTIHDSIAASPPELGDLLDEVKALYQDEDALVGKVLGADGLARFRDEQRRSRTAILAIIASLADEDWDEAIAW